MLPATGAPNSSTTPPALVQIANAAGLAVHTKDDRETPAYAPWSTRKPAGAEPVPYPLPMCTPESRTTALAVAYTPVSQPLIFKPSSTTRAPSSATTQARASAGPRTEKPDSVTEPPLPLNQMADCVPLLS